MSLPYRALVPLLAAALAFLAATAEAQTPAAKPIRLVVPFASGGGTDTVARTLAQKMSERGRLMIVDNRPGASGMLAPAATPPEVVRGLNLSMAQVLKLPEITARLADLGMDVVAGTPEQFGHSIRQQLEQDARLVKLSGAKID